MTNSQHPDGYCASTWQTENCDVELAQTSAGEGQRGHLPWRFEGFLRHCTEDTVWNFIGDRTLRGKDAVRQWMAEAYKEPPVFRVHQMIAEGQFLAAIGVITLKGSNGQEADHAYCDVWRFEDGLMAELNAYVVEP